MHVCLLAIAASFGLSAPAAVAQTEPQVAVAVSCGAQLASLVRTENAATVSNAVAFNLVPGAVTGFVVPAGASRCVKVVFTAAAACRGPAAVGDFCIVRALDNGIEFFPQGGGVQVLVSEDPTQNAHAFEWVRRVGPGNHTIVIQRRVNNAATSFLLDDWTFDVQIHN